MAGTLRKLGRGRKFYIFVALLIGLYYLSIHSEFLLFHTVIELTAITIAICAFIIAWNGQRLHINAYLLLLGVGFGSAASLTLLHTIAYKGMGIFQLQGDPASQLWVASRGVLAVTFLIAPLAIGRRLRRFNVLYGYILVTALLVLSIFSWRIFPVTFIDGQGLTRFKILAEYVICGILAGSLALLWRRGRHFDREVRWHLSGGIIFIIAAELVFTTYRSVFGLPNVIGHLLTLAAFYFFYLAIVHTGFSRPLQLLFRDLQEREEELELSATRLRQSDDLLEAVTRGAEVIIATVDTNLRYTYFNETYREEVKRLAGREIHIGQSMKEVFADQPELQKSTVENWSRTLGGVSSNYQIEFGDPTRYRRIYTVLQTPLRNDEGEIIGAGEVAHDITEQVKAEEALRASEERYRSLFDNMTEGFSLHEIICDARGHPKDYRFLEVNPAFEHLTGLKREELVGRTLNEVLPGEDPRWIENFGRVALTGEPVQFENYSPVLKRYYEVFAYCPAPRQFAVIFRDTTGRKQAEEALQESRKDLAHAQEVGQIGSWRMDVRRNVLTWSEENHRIFGVPIGTSLTYESFLEIVHADDRESVDKKWQAGLRGEPYDIEHRIVVAGEIKWVREKAFLEFDGAGELLGGFGITQDITERKRAEAALRESAETWQQTFASVPDLIMVLDKEHRIQRANRALTEVFGMSEAELTGRHCYEIVHHSPGPPAFCPHVELLKDGQAHKEEVTEPRFGITWEISVAPLRDDGGQVTGSVHVAHDITERKQAEEQMAWLASFPRQNPVPVMEVEADGKPVYLNPAAQQLLPDLGEQGLGHPWLVNLEEINRRFLEGESRILRDVKIGEAWYLQMLIPVQEGRRVRIYAADITLRRMSEAALLQERNRMRLLADTAAQLLAAADPLAAINELCREVMQFLDCQMCFVFLADEKAGRMHLEVYHGLPQEKVAEIEWLEHGTIFCGCRIPDAKSVTAKDIDASDDPYLELVKSLGMKTFACQPLKLGEQVLGTLSFGSATQDTFNPEQLSLMRIIADQVTLAVVRKRDERNLLEGERTRARLAETLVSEIGHRTKNNLAIVSGLLQMQMDREGEDTPGPELIRDAVTRILSFAALHEQMYQSRADSIELVDAIKRIAEIDRQALSAGDIRISVSGTAVNYPSGVGTTLCVVANELLINAIKHGDRKDGGRRVEAEVAVSEGKLTVAVWNSGNTLPKDFNLRKKSRTGLGLVRAIVEDQYGGSFTLAPEKGGTMARIVIEDARLCGGL